MCTWPLALQAPSASNGCRRCCWHQRSSSPLPGPQVETARSAARLQQAQVSDAAQVQHRYVGIGLGEQRSGETRAPAAHPGRPPPRRGLRKSQATLMPVSSASSAGLLKLQRIADAVKLAGPVPHGLSMRADGLDRTRRNACLFQQRLHDFGIDPRQRACSQRRHDAVRCLPGRSTGEQVRL